MNIAEEGGATLFPRAKKGKVGLAGWLNCVTS
jgi:hypothetical protein